MTTAILAILMFVVALLYASVGHAGASGYLAVMGLFGVAPSVMKPTALALNILVASVGSYKFWRAGYFSWKLFWPFALTSIPFAFIGGSLTLSTSTYKAVVGLVLMYSAVRLFTTARLVIDRPVKQPPLWVSLLVGVIIGLLSGLTGVGGGIFLSPLILMMSWAEPKPTAAVAALFILFNSMAGLLGHWSNITGLPAQIPFWGAAVLIGGWIGAELGSKRLTNTGIRQLLAVVLVLAGVKMIVEVL